MDTKRLALAFGLTIIIFVGWNYVSQKMGWVQQEELPARNATLGGPAEKSPIENVAPDAGQTSASFASDFAPETLKAGAEAGEGRLVQVETPLYKAVFQSGGGVLRHFSLKGYRVGVEEDSPLVDMISEQAAAQAPFGLILDGLATWSGLKWRFEGEDLSLWDADEGTLRFYTEVNGIGITRELTFSGKSYVVGERLLLSSAQQRSVNVAFTFGATSLSTDRRTSIFATLRHAVFGGPEPQPEESQYNPTRVAWFEKNSFHDENSTSTLAKGLLVQSDVSWMGVMNNYFMGAVSMGDEAAGAKGRIINGVFHVLVGKTGVALEAGGSTELRSVYFVGPKEKDQLEATPNNLQKSLDYGFFSVIARPLVHLLSFFYGFTNNYGLAIILLTIMIKALFWPLSQKSYRSMNQLKQLQPMLTKIREKHKNDKDAMNREVMQLYKTYKVNPAGGCLPIVVQIPVFFGLYQALLNAIELRHAPFISNLPFTNLPWLADLASPDPYLITPLIMGGSMFLQQRLSPSSADPTQAKIMMFMPLIFTLLFLGFPSGLVVYWLVNNVISIGQQWWQLRQS
ncbi:MAG: membrane protein insertase YidC [Desulfovibrio sp.]|jgi:YidC/Oxa1 family membrane protein insertase|nr:membrane protein insertase YidC [Desulfovibrio sp.]